jgi:electron-transferring-flavoprotein dehydrogenase
MLRVARARRALKGVQTRSIQSSASLWNENLDLNTIERVSDEVDVCIIGGGPAGLSAAIRLKQLEQEKGKEVRIVVIEKGSEIGEHRSARPMVNLNTLT